MKIRIFGNASWVYIILVYFNTCQVISIIIIPAKRLPLLDKLKQSRGIRILCVPATLCVKCPDISSVCLYNTKSCLFQVHRSQPLQFRAARRLPLARGWGPGRSTSNTPALTVRSIDTPGIITKGYLLVHATTF